MQPTGPRIRVIEMLMLIIAVAVGIGWLMGIVPNNRSVGNISNCQGNLRGIMNSMYIYAEASQETFPMSVSGSRNGEMSLFGYRNRSPLINDAPSPSADLWLMLRARLNDPRQFVCPLTTDVFDPIQDTTMAFDFVGPKNLSYAYTYQYHPKRRPIHTGSDPRIPVLADANPYLKGGITQSTSTDRASLGAGNSLNHRPRMSQSVAFTDGHVAIMSSPRTPYSPAGRSAETTMPADNIYTTHDDGEPGDPGNAPTWTRIQIGSKGDYCLVP